VALQALASSTVSEKFVLSGGDLLIDTDTHTHWQPIRQIHLQISSYSMFHRRTADADKSKENVKRVYREKRHLARATRHRVSLCATAFEIHTQARPRHSARAWCV
jgi:hypothetical protein